MADETPDAFAAFDAIAEQLSELRLEATSEHLGEADEIVAAGIASRHFADELRRIAAGEVVTVVATDGSPFRGRILCVGADWVRVGEIADDTGSRRVRLRRVHDLRLDAIVRVSREWTE